jgi:hypothetical protein
MKWRSPRSSGGVALLLVGMMMMMDGVGGRKVVNLAFCLALAAPQGQTPLAWHWGHSRSLRRSGWRRGLIGTCWRPCDRCKHFGDKHAQVGPTSRPTRAEGALFAGRADRPVRGGIGSLVHESGAFDGRVGHVVPRSCREGNCGVRSRAHRKPAVVQLLRGHKIIL